MTSPQLGVNIFLGGNLGATFIAPSGAEGYGDSFGGLSIVSSLDTDGDGIDDYTDAFPDDPNETTDTEGDGVGKNTEADEDKEKQNLKGIDPKTAKAINNLIAKKENVPLWKKFGGKKKIIPIYALSHIHI